MTYHPDPVTLPPGTCAPTGTPDRYEAFDVLSGEMVLTRSHNSGEAVLTGCRPFTATQTIHHDREHPSAIVLPVIPR